MAMIKRKLRDVDDDDDDDVETRSRIDDLNDTLLELILTRLSPWKSVVTSKSVSKRWNSIISNPDFARRLQPQSFPFTLVLSNGNCFFTEYPYFKEHNFPLQFIPRPHKLVANTNDLVVAINTQKGEFYVANPLTKQYVVVVPTPFAQPNYYRDWGYLVGIVGYVDGVSTVNVSHRDNHGFRLVHINSENLKSVVQVYSSETGQWMTYLLEHFRCGSAIPWNNKIHCIISSEIVVIDPFNIDDNLAPRVLNLPTTIGFSNVLSICQNRLRIAQFEESRSDRVNRRIRIWEIEYYDNDVDNLGGNYKTKVKLVIDFKLKRSLVKRAYTGDDEYDPSRYHQMVCCHPNDPYVVYFYYDKRLFYCNVVEKKCRELGYFSTYWNDAFALVHPPLLYGT